MNLATFSENAVKSLNIRPGKFYLTEATYLCRPTEIVIITNLLSSQKSKYCFYYRKSLIFFVLKQMIYKRKLIVSATKKRYFSKHFYQLSEQNVKDQYLSLKRKTVRFLKN